VQPAGTRWDPGRYHRFTDHRLRPALDLLARVPVAGPSFVCDLGCGSGNVTRVIAERFPDARVVGIDTSSGLLDAWATINNVLMTALPGLVGISLVVGGIVIMNIMLLSVTDRTREIGLRKSLGARRRDVLFQFLTEASTLSIAGAALGIGSGFGLAFTVERVWSLPAAVSVPAMIVSLVLGLGVGIASGLYPAYRAARLDPIEALRFE